MWSLLLWMLPSLYLESIERALTYSTKAIQSYSWQTQLSLCCFLSLIRKFSTSIHPRTLPVNFMLFMDCLLLLETCYTTLQTAELLGNHCTSDRQAPKALINSSVWNIGTLRKNVEQPLFRYYSMASIQNMKYYGNPWGARLKVSFLKSTCDIKVCHWIWWPVTCYICRKLSLLFQQMKSTTFYGSLPKVQQPCLVVAYSYGRNKQGDMFT